VLHPLAAKWWSLVARCSSFEGLFKLIALPSDEYTILGRMLFQAVEVQEGRRRYHYPCYPTCMTLLIISTVIGLLSSCILHPVIPMNANLAMLYVTCTSSILAHLWLYCLDGSGHKMDPVPYQDMDMTKIFSLYGTLKKNCIILVSVVIMLGVSFISTSSCKLMVTCLLVAVFSGMYLTAVDLFAQILLCLPMFHMSNLMNNFADNSSAEVAVGVILNSILFGYMDLITSIWNPTQDLGHLMIDVEMNVFYKSINAFAEILLKNDQHVFKMQLDQDLLRISIMKAFGGETNGNDEMQLSTIKSILNPKGTTLSIAVSGHGEPFAASLVRALCTYAGGLGLTLLSISSLESRLLTHSTNDSSFKTWILPPSAIQNAQWAITGASRFMIVSISQHGKILSNWSDNPLPFLVPTFLHPAFNLQYGIQKYDETQDQHIGSFTFLDVLPVVVDCECAAFSVLKMLHSLDLYQQIHTAESDCREWLNMLWSSGKMY
jgi:hypothetical protein